MRTPTLTARDAILLDKKGELYVDINELSGFYCVFGTESGFAYRSCCDVDEASEQAREMASDYGITFRE